MNCKKEAQESGTKKAVPLGPPPDKKNHQSSSVPSPAPSSVCTTVTTALRPTRAPSPTPSTSRKPPIRICPLESLSDPDEQMSAVTSVNPGSSRNSTQQVYADDPNDWRHKEKGMVQRMKYILLNENTYQDVIFEVRNERIKAHQLILKITSPMFARILQEVSNDPISSSETEKVITIEDMEPKIFKQLLKFIYTDEISKSSLNSREIMALLQAAKMYGVNHLYDKCKKILATKISRSIAVNLSEVAASYEDWDLLEIANSYIADHASSIFPSQEFLLFDEENLGRLLDRDDLNIDELSVFINVVRWAQDKCKILGMLSTSTNLRKITDKIILKVRFPLMSPNEVGLQVNKTNILTTEERVQILDYLCVEPDKRDELPPIPFVTTPRRSKKSLAIESASLEKNSSRESRVSTTSTEFVDLASAEDCGSETTSGVSSYSDNSKSRKEKRKKTRAHSSTDNARKIKRRRLSDRDQVKELFGDDSPLNHDLALVNKQINLNDYISRIASFDSLDEIETITLENVQILDFKTLKGQKIDLQNLKSFKMNIKTDVPLKAILQTSEFQLHRLLFFSTAKVLNHWLYKELYGSDVTIKIIINRVTVIDITHSSRHITLNKFTEAPTVLKSLREKEIESLVYSHSEFEESYFPLSLSRLVILSAIQRKENCMSEFLRRFSNLKELIICPLASGNDSPVPLDLDKYFKSRDKLQICGLRGFKLNVDSSLRFKKLQALYLWKTSWDKTFEEKIHQIVPNLVEVFMASVKASPKMFKNILKVSSMKELVSWGVNWDFKESDISDIRHRYKVSLNISERSFYLKKQDDGTWEYTKLNYDKFQENVFHKFQYEFLYQDYQTFKHCI